MRATSLALIVTGILASTSAVGIVLWNSQDKGRVEKVVPQAATDSHLNAGDVATVGAISDPALTTLQHNEHVVGARPTFDSAYNDWLAMVSDSISPATTPLAVGMDLTEMQLQEGAAIGGSARSVDYASPLYAAALSSSSRLSSSGAFGGSAGGNSPGSKTTDPVGGPGPTDAPSAPSSSTDVPTDSSTPQTPRDSLPPINSRPDSPSSHLPPFNSGDNPDTSAPVSVPEPGTLGLLAVGVVGLLLGRRKSRVSALAS